MQWCHGILPSESLRTLSHNSTEEWPSCAWAETREGCHFSDKALIMQWKHKDNIKMIHHLHCMITVYVIKLKAYMHS